MQVHVAWLFIIAIVAIINNVRVTSKTSIPKTDETDEYQRGYNDALNELIDVWNKGTSSKNYVSRLSKMLDQMIKMGAQFKKGD